jgi:deazaflavin-dependent oxidoreductase (nitroreductase family)
VNDDHSATLAPVPASAGSHRSRWVRHRPVLEPVDYSADVPYRRPSSVYLRFQWIGFTLTRLGLSPGYVALLEVPGRRSGIIRRTNVVRATHGGCHYLVGLGGESEWVRNVRAAGGRVTIGRRVRRAATLVEIPPAERPAVIRSYVLRDGRRPGSRNATREARFYFGVGPELREDELARVVGRYPVFRVDYVGAVGPVR